MWNWLKNLLLPNPHFTGLLPDTRLESEKQKDWLHEERVTTPTTADPFSNGIMIESPYEYENQLGTYSCVPHGAGLALVIERKIDKGDYERLSYIFPYRLRSVYPQQGSIPADIFNIYRNIGAPLFTTLPTPQYETLANNLVLTPQEYTEASIFKGLNYWTIQNCTDITTIAQVAQQGHAVAVLIYAQEDEYSRQYPVILYPNLDSGNAVIRHCVTVLPYSGFMKDGKKYVAVQDSAWFGGWKLRYLSEDFIKARCYGAKYWDSVSVLGSGPKPTYTFTQTLRFGSTGNEVKAMQELLISEGLLPTGLNTGYFGGRTLAAVNAFQTRYAANILIPNHLTAPTGTWGPSCIAQANTLCGKL